MAMQTQHMQRQRTRQQIVSRVLLLQQVQQ
jgi:hypothetical protein